MRTSAIVGLVVMCGVSVPVEAAKKPVRAWASSKVTDPITGTTSCTVIASDRTSKVRFTLTGGTYPVVELNSELGLLVGVSSGGKFRFPTGDIVWRVDSNPHREIRAADNPVGATTSALSSDVAAKLAQSAVADMSRMVAAATATSTMAGGEKAKEMLAEMLAGSSLIFRSASIQAFGLPDTRVHEVGQITKDGLKPIPLDASFREGLAACGIK